MDSHGKQYSDFELDPQMMLLARIRLVAHLLRHFIRLDVSVPFLPGHHGAI